VELTRFRSWALTIPPDAAGDDHTRLGVVSNTIFAETYFPGVG
jgi:hypothetical protein